MKFEKLFKNDSNSADRISLAYDEPTLVNLQLYYTRYFQQVIVNDLTEIQEFNQQKVDVLKKQWDDLEKEAIDLVKDHQSQMKKGSDIKQNMLVIELQKDGKIIKLTIYGLKFL